MTNIEVNKFNEAVAVPIKEMESKIRIINLNTINIKDNISSIQKIKNKTNNLDEIIIDKKNELKVLKSLLLLKEKEKKNFNEVVSKYLHYIILEDSKINNKIDYLKQKNIILNKKQEIIDTILNNFHDNLCKITENSNKKITNKNLFKKDFEKILFNEDKEAPISEYCFSNVVSNRVIKNMNKTENNSNSNPNNSIPMINIKPKINEISSTINQIQKRNDKNNDNNKNLININSGKNNYSKKKNDENDGYLNNIEKHINKNNSTNNELDNNNDKKNIKFKNTMILNDNQINCNICTNKNLNKARESFKKFYSKNNNNKEEINTNKPNEKLKNFLNLLIKKIKVYYSSIIKCKFYDLYNLYKILYFQNKIIGWGNFLLKREIFMQIIYVFKNCYKEYNKKKKVEKVEIATDDKFLNELMNEKNKDLESTNIDLESFEKDLNKMKLINGDIKILGDDIKNFLEIINNN